jgi:hypothetical protein
VNYYFTFGQDHVHSIDGFTFDKDVVVAIEAETSEEATRIMFDAFGRKWSMQYDHTPNLKFFPRGIKHFGKSNVDCSPG